MKKQSVKVKAGITIAILFVLVVWFFWPRPVISEVVSSDGVYYDVSVLYGPEHQNEYHLYDEDAVYSSDSNETAYPMDAEFQEELEKVLVKYKMQKTLSFDNQLRVYNITRQNGDSNFMMLRLDDEEGLVQIGNQRYRIREAEMLFREIQPLIDDYLAEGV